MSDEHHPAAGPPVPAESIARLVACEFGLHDDHDTEDGCVRAIAGPVIAEVLGQLEEQRRIEYRAGRITRVLRRLRLVRDPVRAHDRAAGLNWSRWGREVAAAHEVECPACGATIRARMSDG